MFMRMWLLQKETTNSSEKKKYGRNEEARKKEGIKIINFSTEKKNMMEK